MSIKLNLNDENYKVLRTIMSGSSRVGNLDINVHNSFSMLEILPLLQEQHFPNAHYPCTSIRLTISKGSFGRYLEIIDSIQYWTPHVKKLFLHFAIYGRPSCLLRAKLIKAVRKNLHLQFVELNVKDVEYDDDEESDDDENTKNADEQCRAWLERYCERNRKLQMLDKPETIPLEVWPYVYHLASRGGADMLYQQLRQNAWYPLEGWHRNPPPPSPKLQETSP